LRYKLVRGVLITSKNIAGVNTITITIRDYFSEVWVFS